MEDAAMGTNEIDSVEGQPLSCSQCPSVFTRQSDLDEHLEAHKEERPFKCGQCEKSYRHAGSLVNHRKTHQVGLFSCLICHKDLSNPMALKNHLRIHSEEKRFQCMDCGEAFRMLKQLSNHRQVAHSDINFGFAMTNDEDFGDVPGSLDSSMPLLRENHNLLSNLENYIAESMVPADFSHLDLKDFPEAEPFCDTKEAPAEEAQVQNEERRFKCKQCDKAYKHAGSLANHRQSHTIGVYQCAVCFKEFSNRMALKNHSRLHTEYKPYSCPLCDQCFRLPSELTSHQKLHSGEASFLCAHCGQRFLSKRELQRHKRLHTSLAVEAEAGLARTSEGSENSTSEEEAFETSAKISVTQHPFQQDLQDTPAVEPLSNHCGDVNDFSDHLGSSSNVPQTDQENDQASLQETSPHTDLLPQVHMTLSCAICRETFPDIESLTNHACPYMKEGAPEQNDHSNLNTSLKEEAQSSESPEDRPFKCEECSKTYRHAGSLINHKKTHQTGVYNCTICTKQLFNMAALKNHIRAHLKNKANRALDMNFFNSRKCLPDSFQCIDGSYVCTVCGESLATESDLQLHHKWHEEVSLTAASASFPFLKRSPLSCPDEELQMSDQGNDQTYLNPQKALGLSVAEEIRVMKRERGIDCPPWPSQVDKVDVATETVPGNECGLSSATGYALKEEHCLDDVSNQPPPGSYQSQSFAEHHNYISGEEDLSEQESQGRQDPSSAEDRPYKCNLCERSYRHRGSLVNHKHTHQTGIYQCSICPKQYSNVMALRTHVRVHFRTPFGKNKIGFGEVSRDLFSPGMEKLFTCMTCGDTFEDQMDWHNHLLMHSGQKELQDYQKANGLQEDGENSMYSGVHVYEASQDFQLEDPVQHEQDPAKHNTGDFVNEGPGDGCGSEKDIMPHFCSHCGQTFEDFQNFQEHVLAHEGSEKPTVKNTDETEQPPPAKSELCPVADTNTQDMLGQTDSLAGESDTSGEPRMYACDRCEKSYRHSGSLINHKRIHQIGDYVCSVCTKQFNNLATLKNHLRSHQRARRERGFEGSDHLSFFFPDPNFSESAFEACDDSFSCEDGFVSQQSLISSAELTAAGETILTSPSKIPKDLAEDIQTLHTPDPSQGSENQISNESKSESNQAREDHISDEAMNEQIGTHQDHTNDSNSVDGTCGATGPRLLQRLQAEDDAQCVYPVDGPLETEPGIIHEGQAEGSPDVGSTEERPFKCDECGKTYRHAGSLINHKHTHQTGIYQCSFCPKEYSNLMALRNHLRHHTKPQFNRIGDPSEADFFGLPEEFQQPRSGEEVFDCGLCGLLFSDEADFHQHQMAHGSEGPLSLEIDRLEKGLDGCENDGAANGRVGDLHLSDFAFHIHEVEKELLNRLQSEMTDMGHGEAQDLGCFSESHLSHICGFCGKTYDDLESLKDHSLTHNCENATPVKAAPGCSPVDFDRLNFDASQSADVEGTDSKAEIFPKSDLLIEDPKISEEAESRPYACNQCGKTYRHGGSLVNHKKTHQIGDYQCSGCSRQYPNLAAYRNHLRHHPKCKEQANPGDEHRASQEANNIPSLGGSGEELGHSSVNEDSWAEPESQHLHTPFGNCMPQENAGLADKMVAVDPNNRKDASNEGPNRLNFAKQDNDDGIIQRGAAGSHVLSLPVSDTTSERMLGKKDKSEELGIASTVAAIPQICKSCGHICADAVELETHKQCPKQCLNVLCTDLSLGDLSLLPVCDDFENKDRLNRSLELGTGPLQQRPFRCEVCGRSYRHAGSLINHKQTHKTGLFRCSVCQKRFYNMMALKNHNRIHFEMKRYKCTDCNKAFRLQKQLTAHQRIHRDKAAFARRPSRLGKREVKTPIRLLDELMDNASPGTSSEAKCTGGVAVKRSSLKRHFPKKPLNPDERPYRCEQCGRSYRHAGSLLNHKRSHTTGIYSCSICDKTYPNLLAMKNHQRVHFEVKRHVCLECGKAFKWQRQLSRHQLLHTLKRHVCNLCGKTIQGKALLEKHQLEHSNSQSDGVLSGPGELSQGVPGEGAQSGKLSLIPTKSRKAGLARRRIRTSKSENGGVYKNLVSQDCVPLCQACRCVFRTFQELESHHCEKPATADSMTDSLPPAIPQPESEGAAISLNQKSEDGTSKLQKDTPDCPSTGLAEERPYKCNVCGRTYRHAGSLLNHKNTHTTGLYKCSICFKQFFNPMAIRNHIRNHTATKRFQCQECGKAFRASRELITHQRVHTGERPFICPICQRGFSSKLSLKQHQQVHSSVKKESRVRKEKVSSRTDPPCNGLVKEGTEPPASSNDTSAANTTPVEERPYKCNQCDRAYRHPGSLLNHRKTHTTGVYHCPTCHKQFFNLLAMKNHLRIHLDQNRYKCLDCGKAFRVSSRLASHRRIHMQGGPFTCHICSKKFFRKSTFQRHQLLHQDGAAILPQDGVAPSVPVEVT